MATTLANRHPDSRRQDLNAPHKLTTPHGLKNTGEIVVVGGW